MYTANSQTFAYPNSAVNATGQTHQAASSGLYTTAGVPPSSMNLQPEMLNCQYQAGSNGYGAQSGGVYQSVLTPTYDWGTYGTASNPTSPWTTTHTGAFQQGGCNASLASSINDQSQASLSSSARVDGGKKYRHNPYASSEVSTPPISPLMSASHSGIYDASSFGALPDPAAPVYDPSVMEHHNALHNSVPPVTNNLEDQYTSIIGCIAQTACSARGRTLLLNIIRLQHLDKIQLIFEELCASFSTVISDPQGCHVLRFIVEYLQDSHIDTLCSIMTPELAYDMCTLSQHSRRVLQCLVEHHKTIRLQPLMEVICANGRAIAIAKTQQGCIAIMRILENVIVPLKEMVFKAIAPAFATLSIDQFGNYTVQTAIQIIDRDILSSTFEQVLYGQFVSVSCNKFGSNVMEKVVHAANVSLVRVLLNELCYEPLNLHKLINDGYGNFVIQGMVEATAGTPEGRRLCDTIKPLLQSSPYGHKIEAKLRSKRLLSCASSDSNNRSNSAQGCSSVSSGSTCGDR